MTDKKDLMIEEMRLDAKKQIHERYASAIVWAAFWIGIGIAIGFG